MDKKENNLSNCSVENRKFKFLCMKYLGDIIEIFAQSLAAHFEILYPHVPSEGSHKVN